MGAQTLRRLVAAAFALAVAVGAGTAAAAAPPALSGGATVANGVVTLVSNTADGTAANDASSVTFTLPPGTTFAGLKTLSAEFNVTDDGCGGGSPRFSIALASGKNVFVYLGPAPSFNTCALNTWQSSGNLIGNGDQGRYDTSQVQPGTQSSTYAAALALLGQQQVTSVGLVVDAAWAFADKEQTVLARDVTVNGESFPRGEHGNGHGKSPAQQCRAERQLDPAAFKARWGANGGKANAFGKCVSATAKAKHGAKAPHAERGRGDDAKVSAHGRSHGAGKGHGHS